MYQKQYPVNDSPKDGEGRLLIALKPGEPIIIDGDIRIHFDHMHDSGERSKDGLPSVSLQIIAPKAVPIARGKPGPNSIYKK